MNPALPQWEPGTYRVWHRCPWCARQHNAIAEAGGGQPEPGDCSMCWACKRFSVVGDDLQLRRPTEQEAQEIAGDARVQLLAEAARGAYTPEQALDMTRGSPAKDEP